MTRIACVIIATERRRAQIERVIASACNQSFNDIVVVGDWGYDGPWQNFLRVAPLTHSTIDALVKRDVGTLSVNADVLVYLCDDHTLDPGFGKALRATLADPWDVIVPNRYTLHNATRYALNNGEREHYCGGHCGVYRRDIVVRQPWSAHAHHRNWDRNIAHAQLSAGARFVWSPRMELSVKDIEPEAQPWN
jgi:hypothetical protein